MAIEVVSSVKLLGLNISKGLLKSRELYFLKQLKRANVAIKEPVTFHVTCLRPIAS